MSSSVNESPITIGLPVFNDSEFLPAAIESVLAQTHKNFQLIISDNASTDETSEICRNYASCDKRIIYFRQPENIGAYANFRSVLLKCETEFFMWLGAHDLINPLYLASCRDVLLLNKRIVLACGEVRFIDVNDVTEGFDLIRIDTQRSPFWLNYLRVLWEVESGFKVHGLTRTWAAKELLKSENFFGWDHHYLASVCLIGHMAFVPKAEYGGRIIRKGETYAQKVDRALRASRIDSSKDKSRSLWSECEKQHIHSVLKLRKFSPWTLVLLAATRHAFKNRFRKFTREALDGGVEAK